MENNNNVTTNNNNNQEETIMTRSEIVRAYVAAHPTPDQNLCPEIIQNWKDSSDTYVYWSNKIGRRMKGTIHPATTDYHYRWPISGYYFGFYAKAVPEYDMLEVADIALKGGRGVDGEARDWTYSWCKSDRKFIFKGDNSYYTIAGIRQESTNHYYSKAVAETIHTGVLNGFFCMYNHKEEIQKLYPDVEDVNTIYELERFYKNGWVKRKESKTVKNLNEVELGTPDMSKFEDGVHRVHIIEQVNDEYVVIRRFDQNYNWSNDEKHYTDWDENIRIFISKKGKPTVMIHHYYNDSWRISTARINTWGRDNNIGLIGEEIIDTWLPLKYLKGVIDFKTNECLANLVATMRHPIIEQLIKSGYPKIAAELCCDNQIAANLRDLFRVDRETKQPLYKLLGVNKWLLQAVEAYEAPRGYFNRSKTNIIYQIKWLYNRFDISDLSKETIDLLMFGITNGENTNIKELVNGDDFSWRWRHQRWFDVPEGERNFVLKLYRMKRKDPENPILRTYVDTVRLYDRIDDNRKPQVDLKRFGDFNDLVNLHDRLNEIHNIQIEEQQARWDEERRRRLEAEKEVFKKLQKDRREKFNAESTNYVIRVPEELDEITQEGINLHHCVGGYVNSHAHGDTNIIFLRKKNTPDESFYTIEVKNNQVIQIHGSHNKWLGNDPEAIPFVWKWIKDRGFNCPEYILLNQGAGYSKGTEALDKSYLTKEVV